MKYYVRLWLKFIAILALCSVTNAQEASPRIVKTVNANWTFNYFPDPDLKETLAAPGFDDSTWQAIGLPHTWQTFETTNEPHPFVRNPSEKDDSYWWYGWGVYRKQFEIDESERDKKVFVEFDGVQKYSRVYLNGRFIGDHKGGFTSFYFDLTDDINWEGENVLAVLVSNRRNDEHRIPPMTAGNWNVYGGIYRDVRLVIKDRLHIPFQGSYKHEGGAFITTPRVSNSAADLAVKLYLKNDYKDEVEAIVRTEAIDPDGKTVISLESSINIPSGEIVAVDQFHANLKKPKLWHPDTPNLYKLVSRISLDGRLSDEYRSDFGFRFFHWDYQHDDLYINGERLEIRGTNRHQEYPWLGDAHPKWIAKSDMEDIKINLGHNFMRLTHYPNDQYLYELADTLGIAMVEEVPNIKQIDFDETVQEQNVREMIRRDRNHPSILFWSMGNETTDAADSKWAWEEDQTRIIHLRKGKEGGNYVQHTDENLDLEQLLRVTLRGWFDVDDAPDGFNSTPTNGQHASNETWQHQMARVDGGSIRGILGENSNTWLYADHGADREYLNATLKHLNPKGMVDAYRKPKYSYWLTKANYTEVATLFIHPHNWREQNLGKTLDIVIDSNCDEIELFANGRSLGKRQPSSDPFKVVTYENVLIERGHLRAVGFKNGKRLESIQHMPGPPAGIELRTAQDNLRADRTDIAIIEARVVDKDGHLVFDATNTLDWSISGEGTLVGSDRFESEIMKHEEWEGSGYTVAPVDNLVRSTNRAGKIVVRVESEGLEAGEIVIQSQAVPLSNSPIRELELTDAGRIATLRDPSFSNIAVTFDEIYPIRENHQLEAATLTQMRNAVIAFVKERNRLSVEGHGFSVFIDALSATVFQLKGELIADDYNFLVGQYNQYFLLEQTINRHHLSDEESSKLKRKYADSIIMKSLPVDLEVEIKAIKSR